MIATFSSSSYRWLPFWLQKKIVKKIIREESICFKLPLVRNGYFEGAWWSEHMEYIMDKGGIFWRGNEVNMEYIMDKGWVLWVCLCEGGWRGYNKTNWNERV